MNVKLEGLKQVSRGGDQMTNYHIFVLSLVGVIDDGLICWISQQSEPQAHHLKGKRCRMTNLTGLPRTEGVPRA